MKPETILHYRVLRPLGAGGMGVVFLAEDQVLGRKVVLKFLVGSAAATPQQAARLEREARSLAALSHPNIACVYALERDGDQPFLVLEYVEGGTLSERLARGALAPEEAVRLGARLASALAHAHARGVIHRDVKPDNVLLAPDGDPKLTDFGIAHRTGATALTGEGFLTGTLEYLSPEQARGETTTAATDVFSLGGVLYEMLTGSRPFVAERSEIVLHRIQKSLPEPPSARSPRVPPALDALVLDCLAKAPDDRPSAAALASDLERSERDLAEPEARGDSLERSGGRRPRFRRRWSRKAAFGTAAAVLILTGLAWLAGAQRGLGLLPGVSQASVLVAPVEVRPAHDDALDVGRAISETIALNLARAENLRVLPVPDPDELGKGAALERARLARRFGADRLLVGSLTRDSTGVSANFVLVDARANRIVWGTSANAKSNELPLLAANVAREVANQLGGRSTRRYEHFFVPSGRPEVITSPDMAEALGATRRLDHAAAIPPVERLLARFPDETAPHLLEAGARLGLSWDAGPSSPEVLGFERAVAGLERVDPQNPWAQAFRAFRFGRDGRTGESRRMFDRVLDRSDLSASARGTILAMRAQSSAAAGDTASAFRDLLEAVHLDPAFDLNYLIFANVLFDSGRPLDALTRARQALALNPTFAESHLMLAYILRDLGKGGEALEEFAAARRVGPSQRNTIQYAIALWRAGRLREAEAAAEEARRLPTTEWGAYGLAAYSAVSGNRAGSLRWLERALEMGLQNQDIAKDPNFARLRGDPAFESLRSRAQGRYEAVRG